MAVTTPAPTKVRPSVGARRFGYAIGAGINAVLLYVANNLLEWDVLPFLTEEFGDVLPLLSLSLAIGIVANLLYMVEDGVFVKSPTQIVSLAVNLAVAIRMWQVFPFDFSAYDFPWDTLTHVVLAVGIAGTAIGIVVEVAKIVGAAARRT
jgi:hypothetical protein